MNDSTNPTVPIAHTEPIAHTDPIAHTVTWPVQPRPHIRWGGVVWGLLLIVFAAGTLFVLASPTRLAAAEVWFGALSPAGASSLIVAVAGLIIVVFALLAAIRSAQRKHRTSGMMGG